MQLCTQYVPVEMLCSSVSMRADAAINWSQQKQFSSDQYTLPRPDIPSHMVTCPLKPGCFVAYCQYLTFYRSLSTKPCVGKTSVEGPSANAPVDNPSASQRICSAEWLLSGEPFKESIFSWSLSEAFLSFSIILHSRFGSRAASIEQWPGGLHWIVQQSVGHTIPYHANRLPSLCIWQFSMRHVELKFTKFKDLPVLHMQILIWNPRQTWVLYRYR